MKETQENTGNFVLQPIGTIEVPNDFKLMSWMLEFVERHKKKTHFDLPPTIIRKSPTHFICANDRIRVSVATQKAPSTTWDRLQFLQEQGSLLLGAFGVALALEHLFESLPTGKDIYSFDHPNKSRQQNSTDPLRPQRMLSEINLLTLPQNLRRLRVFI